MNKKWDAEKDSAKNARVTLTSFAGLRRYRHLGW